MNCFVTQERDQKLVVECHPNGIHSLLHEVECPSAATQPQRILLTRAKTVDREGTTYNVNGREIDIVIRAFAELQFALKDFKRSLELQVFLTFI
jgi:hypothetical protein